MVAKSHEAYGVPPPGHGNASTHSTAAHLSAVQERAHGISQRVLDKTFASAASYRRSRSKHVMHRVHVSNR